MRRLGLAVSFSLVFAAAGCGGSSGGGGTGGSGTTGTGGAGAKGGTTGTGGASASGGTTGTGGASASGGTTGTGGGSAGATGSGGNAGTTGTGGAGGGAAGTTGTGGAGGALACGDGTGSGETCNTIPGSATGPCVVTTTSADTAPTAMGGSISSGTYQLTSSTFYGTLPDGAASGNRGDFATKRETFLVYVQSATSFNLDQFQADGTQNNSQQGTVAISGTTVAYTQTCPAPGDGGNNGGSAGYTATSSTFTLFLSQDNGILVKVYTKTSS